MPIYDEAWLQEQAKKGLEREMGTPIKLRQLEFSQYYEPQLREYGESAMEASRAAMEREMAKARMRLGYAASQGYGTGGGWQANRLAVERAGLQKAMDIAQAGERFMQSSYLNFMGREDEQAHQMALAQLQFQQQLEMAERLDPSWWENLMNIAGTVSGLYFGYKYFSGGGGQGSPQY
jgi:hypothetical protein